LQFKQYLRCQKQAIDKFDECYMLEGKFVFTHPDNDIIIKKIGPPLLKEEVFTKYYNKLAIRMKAKYI